MIGSRGIISRELGVSEKVGQPDGDVGKEVYVPPTISPDVSEFSTIEAVLRRNCARNTRIF